MLDKRFKGEENLAEKLEKYDASMDVQDLPNFDSLGMNTPKKFPFWLIIKATSVFLLLGVSLFYILQEKKVDAVLVDLTKNEIKTEEINNSNTGNTINSSDINKNPLETSKSLTSIKAASIAEDSKLSKGRPFVENGAIRTKEDRRNKNSNQGGYSVKMNAGIDSKMTHLFADTKTAENNQGQGITKDHLANNKTNVGSKTNEENTLNRNVLDNIDLLPSLQKMLYIEKLQLQGLMVESSLIEVVEKPLKRVSFGIQYNFGKTHAGAHETPFVSSFPTRIEGGKSFGYGFFGQVNLDRRNSIRPSFTYSKNTHLHFVEGLKFLTGPTTNINFELHSHELKFGLDYAFNFLPNTRIIDLKVGAGLAYHKTISTESNNQFTEMLENVKNLNELYLSPLSYKFFLGIDVPVYNDIVIGVEPYVVYQKRRVRYTPSTFLADEGNYNLLSGINLTLRF